MTVPSHARQRSPYRDAVIRLLQTTSLPNAEIGRRTGAPTDYVCRWRYKLTHQFATGPNKISAELDGSPVPVAMRRDPIPKAGSAANIQYYRWILWPDRAGRFPLQTRSMAEIERE